MNNDNKVYYPQVIEDQPFPETQLIPIGDPMSGGSGSGANQTFGPSVVSDQSMPTKRIATELLSTALNTHSKKILDAFEFLQQGAIQIGKFENGVSGDIRLTPSGITGRDIAGLITFAINALTGDAVFKGSIQAQSVITGAVSVGDSNILIDGDTRRILFYDDNGIPTILIGNA